MNELQLQTNIVKSVRKQGGYAKKLSNQFLSGIPDLLIHLPKFIPVLAEVKLIKNTRPAFSRKIGLTSLQAKNLREFDSVNRPIKSSVVLVGFTSSTGPQLVGMFDFSKEATLTMPDKNSYVVPQEKGGFYNIRKLFYHTKIGGVRI